MSPCVLHDSPIKRDLIAFRMGTAALKAISLSLTLNTFCHFSPIAEFH